MARKKKLTRFTVACDGKDRQLLKVRDMGDELSIIVVSAETYSEKPFAGRNILEQRYSVHASSESVHRINEIKQTIRLEGGDLIETILDAKGPKENKLQLIYSRVCPDLRIKRYDVNMSERDVHIPTGDYNPSKRTLLHSLLIGSLAGPSKIASSSRYKQTVCDVGRFRLFLISTHVPLPSHWKGHLIHVLTNVPRTNKEEMPGKLMPYVDGLDAKEARSQVLLHFAMLKQIALSYSSDHIPQDIFAVLDKLGFGVWTENDLREDIRRVSRR